MGSLRNTSSVLQNLGNLHIITGTITVTSNTWTLAASDDTTTLTDIGPGNVSLTFSPAFLAAPAVVATPLKATHEATVFYNIKVEAVSTTTVEFVNHHDTAGTNTTADPDDGDGWMFIAIGLRDN
jgi:hypothetical protein